MSQHSAQDFTTERRRVRFASIEGLNRQDLELACEVWLADLFAAPWISREAMKMGVHLCRYINNSDPALLTYKAIDQLCHMTRDDAGRALELMRAFAAIDAYALDRDDIRVAINLSLLQRIRVLEIRDRMCSLEEAENTRAGHAAPRGTAQEVKWAPPQSQMPHSEAAEADLSPLVSLIGEHIRAAAEDLARVKAHKAA